MIRPLWLQHDDKIAVVGAGYNQKFLLAPIWVLAPQSAHAGPSTRTPIDTSGIGIMSLPTII